ncbi:MAG: YggS family pyridoxal phosphate-dependent enzyme [Cyanobacteria bacterium J06643_13]
MFPVNQNIESMNGHISQKIASIVSEIPQNVELVAITKQTSPEAMAEAYAAGVRNFGENRLQEALIKQVELKELTDVNWHFIGHIQKNKVRKVIENFTWIHSVDSLSLAQRMNRIAAELDLMPKVFLQVKILPDPDKYGWSVEQLLEDLAQLDQYSQLNIQGLMTILPWGLSPSAAFQAFEAVAKLSAEIKQKNYPNLSMSELSMGMSGDYQLAIKAGATKIRLGRTIFGERKATS